MAGASTGGKLHWAERQLRVLEHDIRTTHSRLTTLKQQIHEARGRLDVLQFQLNQLAARLSLAEGAYERTRVQIKATHASLVAAREKYRALRARIDQRARELYIRGPAGDLEFLFGASSLADLTDRVEYINALESQDADLATETQVVASTLQIKQEQLEVLRKRQVAQLRVLRERQAALDAKFREQAGLLSRYDDKLSEAQSLIADLADRKARVAGLVAKFRNQLAAEIRAAALRAQRTASAVGNVLPSGGGPFQYCPVHGGYSDDFGAPRYAGGYHPHAGNDIFAPRGTPIVAPFDGYASADPNGLGGNAVIVHGSAGYVYNAHLDSYGNLGSVSAGTVIGYVGNTGDAQGGATHDHFEWHPNVIPANPYRSAYGYTVIGSAIDPYPYLNQVC